MGALFLSWCLTSDWISGAGTAWGSNDGPGDPDGPSAGEGPAALISPFHWPLPSTLTEDSESGLG